MRRKKGKTTNLQQARSFDQRNLESARAILADVAKYGGDSAFPAMWARRVVERLGTKAYFAAGLRDAVMTDPSRSNYIGRGT